MGRQTFLIAIDVDGVIFEYDKFRGHHYFGGPVEGAKAALTMLRDMGHMVIIDTCRRDEILIRYNLDKHGIPYDYINYSPRNKEQGLGTTKVAADIYIDDKGLRFSGDWRQTLREIGAFKEWWRP